MKLIIGILAIALAIPASAKTKHGRGLLGGGSQFSDFTQPQMKVSDMPSVLNYDEPDTKIDVSIDPDTAVVGGKAKSKGPLASTQGGSFAQKLGSVKKGSDLTRGDGRDAGFREGNSMDDKKDETVGFIEIGSSSWGNTATCIRDPQSGTWSITPDGGPTVDNAIEGTAATNRKLVNQSVHEKYSKYSFKQSLGQDGSDVFAVGWGLSLEEAGINANNVDYYYPSTLQTQQDLRNRNFGATVGALLMKPIKGEPNRCAIVGGGGSGPDPNGAGVTGAAPPSQS